MAKISFTFDSKEKSFSATIDGKAVENVVGVELYPSWDDQEKFRCSIVTAVKDEKTDIQTVTRLMASESLAAKSHVQATESPAFPGFVFVTDTSESKAHADILKFFDVQG